MKKKLSKRSFLKILLITSFSVLITNKILIKNKYEKFYNNKFINYKGWQLTSEDINSLKNVT